MLDSTTAVKSPLPTVNKSEQSTTNTSDKKKNRKKKEKRKDCEQLLIKTYKKPQRYVYFLDKPLEKILIRYI